MESFISGRAESYKTAIKCCGGEETYSVNSKDSMLEAGEYLERLSFWQRPRQKVDLEFIDVTYSVKQSRKGELICFPREIRNIQRKKKSKINSLLSEFIFAAKCGHVDIEQTS